MPWTDDFATDVLDYFFRQQAVTQPTSFTVELYTAPPSRAGGGTVVVGGSYAPQAITFDAPAGSPPDIESSAQVNFPTPTADWGDVVARGIKDQTGRLVDFYVFATPVTVSDGDTVRFTAGGVSIQIG
jgi:hypothetical protein